jgi:hypothetical protein
MNINERFPVISLKKTTFIIEITCFLGVCFRDNPMQNNAIFALAFI